MSLFFSVEFLGAFVAEPVRRMTPRAALLSTLAGIAVGFISGGFLFRTFAHPVVGLSTFGVILLVYFGHVRFKGGLPGGLSSLRAGRERGEGRDGGGGDYVADGFHGLSCTAP